MTVSPSIFLATPDLAVARRWTEAIVAMGPTARIAPAEVAGAGGVADVVVIDLDAVPEDDREAMLEAASARARAGSPPPVLVTAAPAGYADLLRALRVHGLRHLLAGGAGFCAVDLAATVAALLAPAPEGGPDPAAYFATPPHLDTRRVSSSRQVPRLSESAGAWARDGGLPPRLARGLSTVIDELVMNALYSGPTDGDGRPRFAGVPHHETVAVEAGEEIEVRLLRTSERVGVAVRDPFGRLTGTRCVDRLEAGLRRDADQVENKIGGAGLGLYYCFQAASHLAIHVAADRYTEIIAVIDRCSSYRAFASRPKSFTCFEYP